MPDFYIPDGFSRFASQTKRRFEYLIDSHIIEDIEPIKFRLWWKNFETDEEQYLAAHLIDSLIFRSRKMLESSSHYILHMIVPKILEEANKFNFSDLDDFLTKITNSRPTHIRFLTVEGPLVTEKGKKNMAVAKSGGTILRQFQKATPIHRSHLLFPSQIPSIPPNIPLIFIDDCLGTGEQFTEFARANDLFALSSERTLVYIPYIAHIDGIERLKQELPKLIVHPVETLGSASDFFAEKHEAPNIWRRDCANNIGAVKDFYDQTLRKKLVSPNGKYCKKLSHAFGDSVPNNTLKAFYTK